MNAAASFLQTGDAEPQEVLCDGEELAVERLQDWTWFELLRNRRASVTPQMGVTFPPMPAAARWQFQGMLAKTKKLPRIVAQDDRRAIAPRRAQPRRSARF